MSQSEKDTPLHAAAAAGDPVEVRRLLEGGADLNARGADGCTPLHRALQRQHLQVARMLIAAGSSLDACDAQGRSARELTRSMSLWETEA